MYGFLVTQLYRGFPGPSQHITSNRCLGKDQRMFQDQVESHGICASFFPQIPFAGVAFWNHWWAVEDWNWGRYICREPVTYMSQTLDLEFVQDPQPCMYIPHLAIYHYKTEPRRSSPAPLRTTLTDSHLLLSSFEEIQTNLYYKQELGKSKWIAKIFLGVVL
jgi:hypothetical protein